MQEVDFEKLGLVCGLECHQQLETGKLFCRCPSRLRDDPPNVTARRKLRAVASELGTFDPAALKEYRKDRTFLYEGYHGTTCEVEFDEHPPLSMDPEALEVALKIALLLKADVVDEVQVMRKGVIDGSNTSGFQRSALFALNGVIETAHGAVRIPLIALEEDAARVIERKDREVTYRLDRLGIPLVEISTAPEIRSPWQAREVALAIGSVCRATGRVKRGLGTIRQDVNVSIKGGARVEIKGVQELDILDEYVKNEALRQSMLLHMKEELEKKGVKKGDFKKEVMDVTGSVAGKFNQGAFAVKLKGFVGLLGSKASGERIRFGSELSAHAKAAGVKGILHSDELPAYGVDEKAVNEIRSVLGCSKEDAFAMVSGDGKTAREALECVVDRCVAALEGVPEETRNPLPEGFTEYARPLPGAARMYPETDVPPIKVSRERLEALRKELPLMPFQRVKLYVEKFKLSKELAEEMKLSNWAPFFERLVEVEKCDATKAASFLLNELKRLKRENVDVDALGEEFLKELLKAQSDGKIARNAVEELVIEASRNPGASFKELAKGLGKASAGLPEIDKVVSQVVEKNLSLVRSQKERAVGPLMGDAMKLLGGRADGKALSEALKRKIREVSS